MYRGHPDSTADIVRCTDYGRNSTNYECEIKTFNRLLKSLDNHFNLSGITKLTHKLRHHSSQTAEKCRQAYGTESADSHQNTEYPRTNHGSLLCSVLTAYGSVSKLCKEASSVYEDLAEAYHYSNSYSHGDKEYKNTDKSSGRCRFLLTYRRSESGAGAEYQKRADSGQNAVCNDCDSK